MVDLQVDLNLPRHRSKLALILQKMLLYLFPLHNSHLIFVAISTGQLDIGEQKMVLLIAGVSSQDQPEKESLSELVRLSCMTRLESGDISVTCAHCSPFPQVLSPQVATALSNWE